MKSAQLKDLKVKITETEKPVLSGRGAIIKVLGCGLCGSDIVKIKHASKENESSIKLGHEVVGEIVEIDTETPYKKGDIVVMGHHYPCFNCDFCRIGAFSMCETFKKSKEFQSEAENHHNKKIKFLQPDRRGKYLS